MKTYSVYDPRYNGLQSIEANTWRAALTTYRKQNRGAGAAEIAFYQVRAFGEVFKGTGYAHKGQRRELAKRSNIETIEEARREARSMLRDKGAEYVTIGYWRRGEFVQHEIIRP